MPMSTIFQIVEIGTARSAQCDMGFTKDILQERSWSLDRHSVLWAIMLGWYIYRELTTDKMK